MTKPIQCIPSVVAVLSLGIGIYLFDSEWLIHEVVILGLAIIFFTRAFIKIRFLVGILPLIFLALGWLLMWYKDSQLPQEGFEIRGEVATIVSYPNVKAAWQEFEVELRANNSFKILVKVPKYEDINYGERILLTGKADIPKDLTTFSYSRYLAGRGIGYTMNAPEIEYLTSRSNLRYLFGRTRLFIETRSNELFPEPENTLIQGMLIGLQKDFTHKVYQDFKRSGLLHIAVVSGYNMMLVVTFLFMILSSLPRIRRFFFSLIGLASYVLVVGLSPPVLRAFLLSVLVLLSKFIGRQRQVLNLLAISGVLMLVANPFLLYSISFQLSFAASVGLVLLTTPLEKSLLALNIRHKLIRDALSVPLAAALSVFPVLVYAFGEFYLYFLPSNIIAAFLVPLATGAAILALILYVCLPFTAPLIAYMGAIPAKALVFTAHLFGAQSSSSILLGQPPVWLCFMYYLVLFVFVKVSEEDQENEEKDWT